MKNRILGGFSWSLLGNLIWKIGSAIAMLAVARIIEPEALGELGIVRSTVDLFAAYAAMRLGSTLTKYIGQLKIDDPERAGRVISLVLVVAGATTCGSGVLLYFMSDIIATNWLGNPSIGNLLSLAVLFLVWNMYGLVLEAGLAGFENYKFIAFANIFRGVISVLSLIALAFYWGVVGVVIALSLIALNILIIYGAFFYRSLRQFGVQLDFRLSSMRAELHVIWGFALPGLLAGIIISSSMWIGQSLLAKSVNGYRELGIFTAANQWRSVVLMIPMLLGRVLLPIYAEYYHKDKLVFGRLASKQINMVAVVALPITVFMIFGSPLLAGFLGEGYSKVDDVLEVLVCSLYFFSLSELARQIMDGAGKRWWSLIATILWGITYLWVCHLKIDLSGAIGLAESLLVSYVLLFLVTVSLIAHKIINGFFNVLAANVAYASAVLWLSLRVVDMNSYRFIGMFTCIVIASAPIAYRLTFEKKNKFYGREDSAS